MKKFNEKSILNYVSDRNGRDAKTSQMKTPTIGTFIGLTCLYMIPNILKLGDPVIRIFFAMQVFVVVLNIFLSKFLIGVNLKSKIPNDKRFQLLSLICFLMMNDLMFIAGVRIISKDADMVVPIVGIVLVLLFAFAFERWRIIRAMEKKEGIIGKPFEKLKEPTDGIAPCVTAIIIGIVLGKQLELFGIILMLGAVFATLVITRIATQHIYVLYFTKKHDLKF